VIAVCVDFKSAQSYLAVEPTRALEARLGVAFDWRPVSVPPLSRPKPAQPGDDRGTRHQRARAEYHARDLARYAESRGLALGDVHRAPDVALASLGLLWLRRHRPELASDYCARVFESLWRDGPEVAEPAAIEAALGSAAPGFRAWAAGEGPRELAESQRELGLAGVWNVPAYLVDGDVFIGRQHLPMIEWLATGRRGEPPL
jgi:2-hydroxychromene-2-carboxylate isomerase